MAHDPPASRPVPSRFWPLTARFVALVATLLAALGCRDVAPSPAPHPPGGTITSLSDADTLLVTDLTGSLLAETSGTGHVKARFAVYPFGVARRDESAESHQYAASPRDDAVALDHMGARFYAPDLGVWTSPDPLAVTGPERLVTADFAAANPYAYARQSPLVSADRDGHFWHVAIGAAVGALMGGGVEAGRQYFTEGKVSDWGRVGAAAAGGSVAGAITAAVPVSGLSITLGANAGGNVIGGVTERIIASGGRSAGTLGDVAMDAAGSVAGDGVARGAAAAVKRAVAKGAANPVPLRLARAVPGNISTTTLGRADKADVFVTAAADIRGLNATELAQRLTIPKSETFAVYEFWAPREGLASPVFRDDAGFVGGGRTAGGAREFVMPNGPIPDNAVVRMVGR